MTKDELPEGWVGVKLDALVSGSFYGPRFSSDDYAASGVPTIRTTDMDSRGRITLKDAPRVKLAADDLKRFGLVDGDLLVTRTGTIGRCALYTDDVGPAIPSAYLIRFRLRREALDPRLAFLFMQSPLGQSQLGLGTTAVAQPNINAKTIGAFDVPLPPLPEQQRIVERVEALLAQVNKVKDRLDRVNIILKRFRQAVLAAACSGKLTEEWRNRRLGVGPAKLLVDRLLARPERKRRYPKGFQLRLDLELPELPDTWAWADLRLLAEPTEALCYGVVQPGGEVKDGVRLVRAGDLHDLAAAIPGLRLISKAVDESYARSRLLGGEVLVTVVGANVGTAALAPKEAKGFNIARAVAKIPIRETEATYVLLWLRSSLAYRWMFGDAREVARPTLNIEQLETLPVPLPPLEEQAELVRLVQTMFSLADAIEARLTTASTRAQKLPQSILSKAFRGELVPTEAELARTEGRSFEAAGEMLKRAQGACIERPRGGARAAGERRRASVARARTP